MDKISKSKESPEGDAIVSRADKEHIRVRMEEHRLSFKNAQVMVGMTWMLIDLGLIDRQRLKGRFHDIHRKFTAQK